MAFLFTKLVVDDLEQVAAFYAEVFGFKPLHRVSSDEHKYALDEIVLSSGEGPGAHRLLIVRYRDLPCPPSGSCWTGFVVADIDEALAAAEQAGGRIEVGIHENDEHGVRAAILADPAGHLIEVVQLTASRS